MPRLRFRRWDVEAVPGKDLLQLLLLAGADIQYLCMGGTCRTCRVRVISGREHLDEPSAGERHYFGAQAGEIRLGCQATCLGTGDVVVDQ